jgi:hypothetical protein
VEQWVTLDRSYVGLVFVCAKFKQSLHIRARERTKTMDKEILILTSSKANGNMFAAIFTIYMISVYVIVFQLPPDILDNSPILHNVVAEFSRLIPSIERIGQRSQFSQIAQIVLVYELFWMPVLGYIGVRCTPIERNIEKARSHPLRFYFLTPLVIVFMFWGLFFFFPGNPGGEAWSSKIEGSMLTSRFGLASWTGSI